jgi:dihydroorotase
MDYFRRPSLVCAFALAGTLLYAQSWDLLIKGGHVIDPANNVDAVLDVAIAGNKIARVAADLPAAQARKVLDARGLYVTPGLIDLHAHVYGYSGSLFPDSTSLVAGTTTIADCGGAGWRTFEEFKAKIIDKSRTRVLSFLNIVGRGMVGAEAENNVEDMDPAATAAKIKQYPGLIVGIKTAHYSRPGWTALERAVEAGRLSGTPVIVDNNILSYTGRNTRDKVLKILRPGDIHTHTYNDRHLEIIDRFSGRVNPDVVEARKRGVLFDLGHGSGSFLWPVATRAMAQGFPPDTISTDLHSSSILIPQSDMPNCISKMLALGMTLQDAVARSTVAPARAISKFPELGTLSEGRLADVAAFELQTGVFAYKDAWQKKYLATRKLAAVLTIRDGRLVFDANGLGFPLWTSAGNYEVIR